MSRYGRFDPLAVGPQMLMVVIEAKGLAPGPDLLDLSEFPDAGPLSWYLASEGRFVDSRPSSSHVWGSGGWVLDPALSLEASSVAEREWRDVVIAPAFSMRDRHRDELELGIATTLTPEQFAELLAYIQKLRDWPQSELFPASEQRPAPPAWYQSGE